MRRHMQFNLWMLWACSARTVFAIGFLDGVLMKHVHIMIKTWERVVKHTNSNQEKKKKDAGTELQGGPYGPQTTLRSTQPKLIGRVGTGEFNLCAPRPSVRTAFSHQPITHRESLRIRVILRPAAPSYSSPCGCVVKPLGRATVWWRAQSDSTMANAEQLPSWYMHLNLEMKTKLTTAKPKPIRPLLERRKDLTQE
jgi:hypothetical protein